MTEYRHGALLVLEQPRSQHEINVELRKLDPDFFVERQLTIDQQAVWCVCKSMSDQPPVVMVEWRDERRRPLELSYGIVSRAQQLQRDPVALLESVISKNRAKQEELRRKTDEGYADAGADAEPRITGKVRPVLHRGQHLRMSRDKRRERGEKV